MKYPVGWPFWRFMCTKLNFTPKCKIHVYEDKYTEKFIITVPCIVGMIVTAENKEEAEKAVEQIQSIAAQKIFLDLDVFDYKNNNCDEYKKEF